ncbi:hypothetical protein, partial [Escherichia coli]|uniref:hypothetical protein n=1 Tax=Escherichia coli TaxID=562 RepID=UPI00207B7F49
IGGIMEHIEQAGVHSGDPACSLAAYTLSQEIQDVMRQSVQKPAFQLQVPGLSEGQFAVKNTDISRSMNEPGAADGASCVSKTHPHIRAGRGGGGGGGGGG